MSRMLLGLGVACALTIAGGIGLAHADARIDNVHGQVFVNQGEGFFPVLGAFLAQPGDRVIAEEGSSATLVYDISCEVPVKPGAVVVVMSRSPCLKTSPTIQGETKSALNGGSDLLIPAVGILAIGGGVAAFMFLGEGDGDKDNGVSP